MSRCWVLGYASSLLQIVRQFYKSEHLAPNRATVLQIRASGLLAPAPGSKLVTVLQIQPSGPLATFLAASRAPTQDPQLDLCSFRAGSGFPW